MDQNMYNYHGMNSRGGHGDRYAEQMQMQAQAEHTGQAQQLQMAGSTQQAAMARRPTNSDLGLPPAQQPRYQHTRPGEPVGFMQPIHGAPTPHWAQAYQMPTTDGAPTMYEALGMPAANYSRHPSPYNQSSAYSEVRVQHSMSIMHVRKERSTYTLDFRLALVMIA
mmetsp:Transcript_2903/g.6177  ORF Transcript_2903/g.6177 Transcript_2903/m.6177 type:complete len:166 (-) Transcript_2903:7-504(-)